jgi:hypothetical protein
MTKHRPLPLTLLFLEGLLAVCAALGGTLLLLEPSGSYLGLSPRLLDGLPFHTFVIPGIAMIVGNALIPMVMIAAALRRLSWADTGHVLVGMLVTSWLLLQIVFVGTEHVIQPMFLALGIAISALAIQGAELLPRPHAR